MTKRILIVTLAFIALFNEEAQAQDPHFTQFYAAPLYLNPAMAGATGCPKVSLNYRRQFPNLSADFNTMSFSYDQHVDALHGGVGIMVMKDNAGRGTLGITEVSGVYSYQLVLNRQYSLLAGFQGTYRQRSLDWSKLTFPDQIDAQYGFVKPTGEIMPGQDVTNQIDFSTGVILFSDDLYVGAALNHITEPDEAFLQTGTLPMKLTVHAGSVIEISKGKLIGQETSISPNILYQKQQDFEQLNFGVAANYKLLSGGFWWRQNFNNPDALNLILGMQLDAIKIGFSYDLTISELGTATGGAQEISLSYRIPCSPRNKTFKTINCPTF
ncbi:MAG: type IX secretion system PorP/SprF family membrane protein [Flavobacteriales bacterium]|jgi:type IX secretion system PorP/SprF family membrane protein